MMSALCAVIARKAELWQGMIVVHMHSPDNLHECLWPCMVVPCSGTNAVSANNRTHLLLQSHQTPCTVHTLSWLPESPWAACVAAACGERHHRSTLIGIAPPTPPTETQMTNRLLHAWESHPAIPKKGIVTACPICMCVWLLVRMSRGGTDHSGGARC